MAGDYMYSITSPALKLYSWYCFCCTGCVALGKEPDQSSEHCMYHKRAEEIVALVTTD